MVQKFTTDVFHALVNQFTYQGPGDTLVFQLWVQQNGIAITGSTTFTVNVPNTSGGTFSGPYPPIDLPAGGNAVVGPADGVVNVQSVGGFGGPWQFVIPHVYDLILPQGNVVVPYNLGVLVYTGNGGQSLADFSWNRGSPGFTDEYLDISATDNSFAPGTYLPIHTADTGGIDPISGQPFFSVDGNGHAISRAHVMIPNAQHWWRVGNFLNGAWYHNNPVAGVTDFLSANPGQGGPQVVQNVQVNFS